MNESGSIAIHATALVVGEAGLVIRGPSGAGKSRLASLLLAELARSGRFARLIGDDRILVRAQGAVVVVSPHPAIAGLLERRTQPFGQLPYVRQAVARLVVDLYPPATPLPRYPAETAPTTSLAGVDGLPLLCLQGPPDVVACHIVLEAVGTRLWPQNGP